MSLGVFNSKTETFRSTYTKLTHLSRFRATPPFTLSILMIDSPNTSFLPLCAEVVIIPSGSWGGKGLLGKFSFWEAHFYYLALSLPSI